MKEFLAGLILTLFVGGAGLALEMKEKEVKFINADSN